MHEVAKIRGARASRPQFAAGTPAHPHTQRPIRSQRGDSLLKQVLNSYKKYRIFNFGVRVAHVQNQH